VIAKRVLIVDDEPFIVGVRQECFAPFNHGHSYEVMTAGSAADAFDILQRQSVRPDPARQRPAGDGRAGAVQATPRLEERDAIVVIAPCW
jgi:CheY-like chemotaxis protein